MTLRLQAFLHCDGVTEDSAPCESTMPVEVTMRGMDHRFTKPLDWMAKRMSDDTGYLYYCPDCKERLNP